MLTKKQIKDLRKQIVLNSLFLDDYSNTLFIKNITACAFFDSYIDYLYEIASENGVNNIDVLSVIQLYDTIDRLYDYYVSLEYNALLQDDFIATKPVNNSDSIVIYEIDYNYVLVGGIFLSGLYMDTERIKRLKLYYGARRGFYFIYNHRRYYIDDFMKVNF